MSIPRPSDDRVPNTDARDPWRAVLDDLSASSERTRMAGPWQGRSRRALVLIVAALVAVAGWWWWDGRPRPVEAATVDMVVASGTAIPGTQVTVPQPVATLAATIPAAPTTSSVEPSPMPAPGPEVVVHVAGLVHTPGLVHLPAGSRVADAIAAAGGVTRVRAADTVNLARLVVDGEQILVGQPGGGAPSEGASPGNPLQPSAASVIDLNTATAEQLDALPGIGPVLAARIVQWRTDNGRFTSVDELSEVSGIGDAVLARLRASVRV